MIRHHTTIRPAVLLAVVSIATACVTEPELDPCVHGPLEVWVSWSGARPTFTWTPACPVGGISVIDLIPGCDDNSLCLKSLPLWSVSDRSNGIVPPVQYGDTLPGAVTRCGLEDLPIPWPCSKELTGGPYEVRISSVSVGPDGANLLARTRFRYPEEPVWARRLHS